MFRTPVKLRKNNSEINEILNTFYVDTHAQQTIAHTQANSAVLGSAVKAHNNKMTIDY